MAARVSVVKWSQISDVSTTLDEINRIHGLSSSVQDQLNEKVDTVYSIDPDDFFNDYTKNNSIALIDSIINARLGNLQLAGSKLTYTVASKTYTAQTDSADVSAYGSELVSNGAFANGTGWDNNNGFITFTGGVAQVNTGSTTYDEISFQTIAIENGKTYKVDISITSYTQGELVIGLGNQTGAKSTAMTASGNYSFTLTASQSIPLQVILIVYDVPFVGSIDNISVKEVL